MIGGSSVPTSLAVAVCAGLVAWLLLRVLTTTMGWQRDRLTHLSRVQFEELFLFVDTATFLRWNVLGALLVAACVIFERRDFK